MSQTLETWCDRDEHVLFEHFIDFNEWLDGNTDEAKTIRIDNGIDTISQPSKALFAGDKEAYEQAFKAYRIQRRHEVLSGEYIASTFGDDHWFERNETRFDQLVSCLLEDSVVPFIGAGVSVAGGFPTWKDHLRKQGKTAGIDSAVIESQLANGEYESIIETIESTRGPAVFAQEIRDAFSKTGSLEDITLVLSELFSDTLITTNYDRLLEQSFDVGPGDEVQTINGNNAMEKPDPEKVTIIKLHGDIKTPTRCILGKRQYDEAYGETDLDLSRPIPKLLRYYYTTRSLLFIGCSLNNDRTIQVFKAVKEDQMKTGDFDLPEHFSIEQAPDTITELANRNAELLNLGITPIWYPNGEYDKVEAILRHALNELKHKQSVALTHRKVKSGNQTSSLNPDSADKSEKKSIVPDFAWYSAESTRLGLKTHRCPFASVHRCPRYYQSLSLLGEAGCTAIPKEKDDALLAQWKLHPLWPATGEQETAISGSRDGPDGFHNFCPEVAYDTFNLFAKYLGKHVGEIDREIAASRLKKEGVSRDDPRWIWNSIVPQHYVECPLYSPLSHDSTPITSLATSPINA